MFFGVSHVDVPVNDLQRARHFWVDGLGFTVKRESPAFVDIETGNVLIRLVETPRVTAPAAIRLVVADPVAAARQLVLSGGQILYGETRTDALELTVTCADPSGNQIVLWRELSEDEHEAPPLPTTITWGDDAEQLMKGLLSHVPALFRGLARRKVTRNAEYMAMEARRSLVDRDTVIRAYILSNARVTRDRVRRPLELHGIDPGLYAEEFQA